MAHAAGGSAKAIQFRKGRPLVARHGNEPQRSEFNMVGREDAVKRNV